MPVSLKEFESVLPRLVDDLTAHCQQYNLPQNALEWYQKSLNHNALGGKCNRGMSVVDTVSILKSEPLKPESPDFFPAATLGWLIELLQAYFLIADDIMDGSYTRRGQPCWFRYPEVGMIAINDSFMVDSAIYIILKKYFRSHKDYVDMIELFHEVTFQTELGQSCDLLTAPEDKVDLANFSMEKYMFIVRFKTAFYSFYLSVAIALHFCGLATPKNLQQAKDILIPMGEYFQVQDDYLDAYADPKVLGKIGTDIQDNKCSWLVNQALQRANPEQRAILEENYGRKDTAKETKVKELYRELDLEEVYKEYEEKSVGEIREMIKNVDESEGLKKHVFEAFLQKIYKRSK